MSQHFKETPVSEKPTEASWVLVTTPYDDRYYDTWFDGEEFVPLELGETNELWHATHWLKPTTIQEITSQNSQLGMQNDHLEEGCNERDKELVELRELYSNACQTIADLQIKLGEALAQVNRFKNAGR